MGYVHSSSAFAIHPLSFALQIKQLEQQRQSAETARQRSNDKIRSLTEDLTRERATAEETRVRLERQVDTLQRQISAGTQRERREVEEGMERKWKGVVDRLKADRSKEVLELRVELEGQALRYK